VYFLFETFAWQRMATPERRSRRRNNRQQLTPRPQIRMANSRPSRPQTVVLRSNREQESQQGLEARINRLLALPAEYRRLLRVVSLFRRFSFSKRVIGDRSLGIGADFGA
jgi:hypothetical protein